MTFVLYTKSGLFCWLQFFTSLYPCYYFMAKQDVWMHEKQQALAQPLPYSHVHRVWQVHWTSDTAPSWQQRNSIRFVQHRDRREEAGRSDYCKRYRWSVALSSSPLCVSLSLSVHGWRWKSVLNREERTAADGEKTKEAFCPSSLLLLLHAFPLSLCMSPPFSLFPVHSFLSLCLCMLYSSLCLTWYRSLSSLFSPPLLSFLFLLLPPPPPSSLLLFPFIHSGPSEHSVEIGSVTVSLETDRVGLPGVSTQQKSKTAVTSVKSAPIWAAAKVRGFWKIKSIQQVLPHLSCVIHFYWHLVS